MRSILMKMPRNQTFLLSLCACEHKHKPSWVSGARSIYHWQGAIEEASEWLLIIKSRRDLADELRAEIERLHSYEVPEVLVLAVVDGSPGYLGWMERELRPE